jgi:hypothetical protein
MCMIQFENSKEWVTDLIKLNVLGPVFQSFTNGEDEELHRQGTIFISYLLGNKELEDHLKKRLQKSHATPMIVRSLLSYELCVFLV